MMSDTKAEMRLSYRRKRQPLSLVNSLKATPSSCRHDNSLEKMTDLP